MPKLVKSCTAPDCVFDLFAELLISVKWRVTRRSHLNRPPRLDEGSGCSGEGKRKIRYKGLTSRTEAVCMLPGGVAEWLNALVSKTSMPQGIEGSNPSPSATGGVCAPFQSAWIQSRAYGAGNADYIPPQICLCQKRHFYCRWAG